MTLTRLEKTTLAFLLILLILGIILLFVQANAAGNKNRLVEDEIRKIQDQTSKKALSKTAAVKEDDEDSSNKVNVNEADVKMLDEIPGVGKTMAERIVEFRTKSGAIKELSELLAVEGMSQKKLAGLSRYLSTTGGYGVGNARKLNLNFATFEEIEKLPGVGKNLAKSIIDTRNAKGGFKALSDLEDVPGLTEKTYNKFADAIEIR